MSYRYFDNEDFIHEPAEVDVRLKKKMDRLRQRVTDKAGRDTPILLHVCRGKPGVHAEDSYHYPTGDSPAQA